MPATGVELIGPGTYGRPAPSTVSPLTFPIIFRALGIIIKYFAGLVSAAGAGNCILCLLDKFVMSVQGSDQHEKIDLLYPESDLRVSAAVAPSVFQVLDRLLKIIQDFGRVSNTSRW